MACSSQQTYGYEDSRFQHPFSESFHCSICLNVLKKPKMCVNNQHVFCQDCIIRSLRNDLRCPQCREELTAETLKPVSRVLMSGLSELHIKCDYFDRGCLEYFKVGNLDNHVIRCIFAPIQCSNTGCTVAVNKRDIFYHEMEICQFKRVKSHDCGELRNEIGELRNKLGELRLQNDDIKTEITYEHGKLREEIGELREEHDELREEHGELREEHGKLRVEHGKLRVEHGKLRVEHGELREEYGKLQEEHRKLQEEHRELRQKETANFQKRVHFKPKKRNICLDRNLFKCENSHLTKKDIIIAGGSTDEGETRSVEMYSWDKGSWAQLPEMNASRAGTSCFVYQNQVFVAGGEFDLDERTDIIEVMNIDQEPLQWQTFPGKLPTKLSDHKTVVYDNKLIVIGGMEYEIYSNCIGEGYSNSIYEILLTPPYSSKLLSEMIPRVYHGVELVNNKVFILGGEKSSSNGDIVDNVCEYDVVKKECRAMSPLPYPVCEMSTAVWRNKIIVIGGKDKYGEILNKVMMYDVETGESETLPYMKYKRAGCAAVATGDGMVVMGGYNEENRMLKSVEYFKMSSRSWQELPSMTKVRSCACAVVKP